MRTPIFAFLALLMFVCPTNAQIAGKSDEVVVGVRTDARPFVWWDESTKGFHGFIYNLCLKAVAHAGYKPDIEKVDSKQRADFLKTGAGGYDLLCDPTTLTLSRAMRFADNAKDGNENLGALTFSPIYFVANGGHVELKAKTKIAGKGAFQIETEDYLRANSCDEVITETWAQLQNQQENRSVQETEVSQNKARFKDWFNANVQLRYHGPDERVETPNTNVSVWGYVRGTSVEKKVLSDQKENPEDRTAICILVFDTHEEAAARFCDGYLARYYGDLDIIRATISAASQGKPVCEYEEATEQQRTYEPYAFVVSSRRHPDFPSKFAAALYALFHSESVQEDHAASFPDVVKTNYLNTLFLINMVPSGESAGGAARSADE